MIVIAVRGCECKACSTDVRQIIATATVFVKCIITKEIVELTAPSHYIPMGRDKSKVLLNRHINVCFDRSIFIGA